MKKKKIFALMAAALSLAACSTNDIADITHDDADNVVNVASVTRSGEGASTTSTMTAPFHLINITQATKRNVNFEADFTFDNNTNQYTQVPGSNVVWYNVKDADGNETPNVFKAFSPIKTNENNASLNTFNLPTDQSSAALLQSADRMIAEPEAITKSAALSNKGLALNFLHKNAKLCFTIDSQDDISESDLSGADIKVLGSIKPYYNPSTSNTIEAIVEPKDYTTADEIIHISLRDGDETYALNFPQATTFAEGKQYNYSLKLGHNAITISSVSVTDWTPVNVTTGKENEATNGNNSLMFTFTGSQTIRVTYVKVSQQSNSAPRRGSTGESDDEGEETLSYTVDCFSVVAKVVITKLSDKDDWDNECWEFQVTPASSIEEVTVELSIRGLGSTGTAIYSEEGKLESYLQISFENNIPVACSGDILSLVDHTSDTSNARFCNLFKDCKPLTSAPKLPATTLASYCYEGMFEGCESLENAPELPATNLSEGCYKNMFKNCKKLKNIDLPAETFAPECYQNTLSGCSELEYLNIGAQSLGENGNSAFYNFMGNREDKQEVPGDDDGSQIIDMAAGINAHSRTLVISEDVYKALEQELPDNWKNTFPNTNVLFQNTDTGETPGPEGPVM